MCDLDPGFSEGQTEVVFLSLTLFGDVPASVSSAREVGGGSLGQFVLYKTKLWSWCSALRQVLIFLNSEMLGMQWRKKKPSQRKYCLSTARK